MRPSHPLWKISLTFLVASACSTEPKSPSRHTASSVDLPPVEQGEVWTPEHEEQAAKIVAMTEQLVKERDQQSPTFKRDAHPKHHGCAKATFKIDTRQLPPALQVGIFSPGSQKEYPAWVRFSNGDTAGSAKSDYEVDIRGMAVKLMNVPGTPTGSQDFLMCTAPEFFSKDGEDYLELFEAFTSSTPKILWYMATHGTNRNNFLAARVRIANPVEQEYFSSVPYKLGPTSMRFSVVPCSSADTPMPTGDSDPHYLRRRLIETLAQQDVCYDFYVQPNRDSRNNPIEDPRLKWDENVSPKIKVATIQIPRQTGIDTKEQLNFCENVSFNPWHSQPDLRPMGQINRTRAFVYKAVSELRHRENKIPIVEPKSHQPCQGETASLCQDPIR